MQEAGLVQIRRCGSHGAIEPLDVPDLKDHTLLRRTLYQLLRTLQRIRQRLLHEQRNSALQHRQTHGRVHGSRHRYGHGVHALQQSLERRVPDGLELLRHLGRACGILVVDACKLEPRHPPEQTRVVEAEGPGADHTDSHRSAPLAHTSTPRWDPSMNLRKFSTSGVWGSSARALAIPWLTVMSELKRRR